jgi:hypothetical protein
MNWVKQVDRDGYGIVPAVVGESLVRDLLEQQSPQGLKPGKSRVRNVGTEAPTLGTRADRKSKRAGEETLP